MARRSFVPPPVATCPGADLGWCSRSAGGGVIGLYSAAGGSMMPWALPHGVRFLVFLGLAVALSYRRPQTFHDSPSRLWRRHRAADRRDARRDRRRRAELARLGFIRLQPSELMKPVLVLVLARFYAHMPPARSASFARSGRPRR
jgi:rod shape determining protein RodA